MNKIKYIYRHLRGSEVTTRMAGMIHTRKDRDGRSGKTLRRGSATSILAVALLVAIAFAGVVLPDSAEAGVWNFNNNSGCSTKEDYTTLQTATMTEDGWADCSNRSNLVTMTPGSDALVGYYDNGGYDRRYSVDGVNTTGSTIYLSGTSGDTVDVQLVEVDPSDGSVVQTLGTAVPVTVPATAGQVGFDATNMDGNIGKGYTFGFIVHTATDNAGSVGVGWGRAGQKETNVDATITAAADTVDVTNATPTSGNVNQGSRDVEMQAIQLYESVNGYTAALPKLKAVTIKGIGSGSIDEDITAVKIWQSSDTTIDGGDTLLGEGYFDSSGNLTIDIPTVDEPDITTTPGWNLIIGYDVYINAGDTNTVLSRIATAASLDVGDDYIDPAGYPISSNTLTVQAIVKDTVNINDEAVWSSGYVEQGVWNAPVMSFSLAVTASPANGQADVYSVRVDEVGDASIANITAVKAWWSSDNSFDSASDTLMTSGTDQFELVNGGRVVTMRNTSTFTVDTTKKYVFITYDIASTANTTKWIRAETVNELYVAFDVDLTNTYTGYQSNLVPIRQTNFRVVGECFECHTFPPTDLPSGVTTRNPYAGAVVGDHDMVSHVPWKNETACASCHWPLPVGVMNHQDGIVQINSTIYDGGSYNKSDFTHTNNPTTATCGGVTCHQTTAPPQWGVTDISCAACHNQDLQDSASVYKRRDVVSANGDLLNSTIVSRHIHNTTAFADSSCEVCHLRTTHTREGDPAVKLFNGDTGEAIQYDGSGASATPACVSCHDADGVARLGQNAMRPFWASGDETAPYDVGWKAGQSAHDVAANLAEDRCLGCHGNEEARLVNSTLDPAKNAHGSSEVAILMFSYDSAASQGFCYSCHDGSGANRDIQEPFGALYNHASQGKEHCMDCHDPHEAEAGLHEAGLGVPGLGNVLKGPNWDYEYEVCLRTGCHDQTIAKTFTDSDTDADTDFGNGGHSGTPYATNWGTIPDLQTQFDTSNLAYHPLFAKGRNQPHESLNANWTSAVERRVSGSASDHTFVDGWGAGSLVTCSDCHDNRGDGNSGARGPHGSSRHWILAGIDNTVSVTKVEGTSSPNLGATGTYQLRNFCVNCHRSDVYGLDDAVGSDAGASTLSRAMHDWGSGCMDGAYTSGSDTMESFTGCMFCHGGAQVAGIHGTSLQASGTTVTYFNHQQGKRFMNGSAWTAHTLGDITPAEFSSFYCYTGSPSGSDPVNSNPAIGAFTPGCASQHSAPGGRGEAPNYVYTWYP
jgi:hypothetical protein